MATPYPYSEEIGNEICDIIATSNKSLSTIIAENPTFPKMTTIFKWLNTSEEFAKNYARAKENQAEYLAEEILRIADDSSNDTVDGEFGPMEHKEWINRSRLRVDARKWIASKLKPKKFGDRLELDGKVGGEGGIKLILGNNPETPQEGISTTVNDS